MLTGALGDTSADGISTRATKLSRKIRRIVYSRSSYLRSMKLNRPALTKILFFYWLNLLLRSDPNTCTTQLSRIFVFGDALAGAPHKLHLRAILGCFLGQYRPKGLACS